MKKKLEKDASGKEVNVIVASNASSGKKPRMLL